MRRVALGALLCLLAACDGFDHEPDLLRVLRERAQWDALNIRDYNFVYGVGCVLCDPFPVRVEVRGGQVVRSIALVSGDTLLPEADWRLPTVDQLFDDILEARKREDCGSQRVEFDAQLHYPRLMTCSGSPKFVDSGSSRSVTEFVVLVPGAS
jgi:hypothetical protein